MQKMQDLIAQVIDFSQKKKQFVGFDGKDFTTFVKNFFSVSTSHDFLNYSIEELYNAALLSFDFYVNKKLGEFKVRICNPTIEKNGFESAYTFLDIVNDDMPFLVDSTVAYLDKYGVRVRNIIHPIYSSIRDKSGKLEEISTSKTAHQESIIQLHLDKLTAESDIKMLQENISKILINVALVVKDWQPMIELVNKAADQIDNAKKINKETDEIKEFLN